MSVLLLLPQSFQSTGSFVRIWDDLRLNGTIALILRFGVPPGAALSLATDVLQYDNTESSKDDSSAENLLRAPLPLRFCGDAVDGSFKARLLVHY